MMPAGSLCVFVCAAGAAAGTSSYSSAATIVAMHTSTQSLICVESHRFRASTISVGVSRVGTEGRDMWRTANGSASCVCSGMCCSTCSPCAAGVPAEVAHRGLSASHLHGDIHVCSDYYVDG
jgi:hypothetical protein